MYISDDCVCKNTEDYTLCMSLCVDYVHIHSIHRILCSYILAQDGRRMHLDYTLCRNVSAYHDYIENTLYRSVSDYHDDIQCNIDTLYMIFSIDYENTVYLEYMLHNLFFEYRVYRVQSEYTLCNSVQTCHERMENTLYMYFCGDYARRIPAENILYRYFSAFYEHTLIVLGFPPGM